MLSVKIMKTPSPRPVQGSASAVRKFAQGRSILLSRLTLVVLLLLSPAAREGSAFAATPAPASGPSASAAGITGENALLNGAQLIAGATLFRGDTLTLGADSSAALQFGKGLVLVAPRTELVVETGGVSLRSGRVQIRLAGGDLFAVSGPFSGVHVAPSGGNSGSAEILVGGTQARVSAVAGVADVMTEGSDTPYRLHAGDVASMDAGRAETGGGQGGSGSSAGQVSRLLPDVQIGRASQQMTASIAAPVYWNDDLHSGPVGRARVSLNDGSLLNLGSNSELLVVQHDAQAQQTSLDLAVGRMRAVVVKLSRPGAKFEIRTSTGVAGVIGTDFYLLATPDFTEIIVFEDVVRFTPFATGQGVTVPAGMKARISRDGSIAGPLLALFEEIQEAKNSTDVPETVAQRVQPSGRKPVAPVIISVATGGAVIGIGLALSRREPVSRSDP
jgi:hypothetical protein